ncbi:MAG: type VI secretion system baseplate subunit TssG [Desulfovibrionaceae bacterium]|nr:type VI secretion system baseplate subunit TssG [Desulfovibrionaceae bacterium]
MATETRRETTDLRAQILANPSAFTLNHLIHLLAYLNAQTPKEQLEYLEKDIFIRPWLSLAFPSTEVQDLVENDHHKYVVTNAIFGLYSTMGPLPTLYTEELLEEARNDESVTRDFLDIVNNHVSKLAFLTSNHNLLANRTVENEDYAVSFMQFCLRGQVDASLREPGLPKAYLTEIYARRTRSAAQLELFLSYVLQRYDVEVEQCVERTVQIPKDQRARLGAGSVTLGTDAMLGMCLKDRTGKFRIHLTHVATDDVKSFLPGASNYQAIKRYMDLFLDAPLDYELTIHPLDEKPKKFKLGVDATMGFYLGTPKTYQNLRIFWKKENLPGRPWMPKKGGDTILLG